MSHPHHLSRVSPGFVPLFLTPCRRSRHRHDRFASLALDQFSPSLQVMLSVAMIHAFSSPNARAGCGEPSAHSTLFRATGEGGFNSPYRRFRLLPFPAFDITSSTAFLSQLSFTTSNCSIPSIYIIALFYIPFQPSFCIRVSSAFSLHRIEPSLFIHSCLSSLV